MSVLVAVRTSTCRLLTVQALDLFCALCPHSQPRAPPTTRCLSTSIGSSPLMQALAASSSSGAAGAAACAAAARRPARSLIISAAKKEKKGGKAGSQKKGGGALAGLMAKKKEAEEQAVAAAAAAAGSDGFATPAQWGDPEVIMQLLAITSSYKKAYDEFLMEAALDQLAEAMYKAPFVVLAHNKFEEGVDDPLFTYANRAALQLFEADWDGLVGLPSRLSADQSEQANRNQLIQQCAEGAAISNYEGWRQSTKGKRFKLKGVRLFNVTELDGSLWGQAAVFSEYELEDGTIVKVQGEAPAPSAVELPPSAEDVAAAEAAVAEQGAAVRALKEQQGLANQDPQVQAGVAELQARKQALAELQARYDAALAEAAAAEAAPPTLESVDEEDVQQ